MSRKRSAFILLLVAVFLGGHLAVRISGSEWWPFSNYPMYSNVFEPRVVDYFELYGVAEDKSEVKLSAFKYFWPFNDRSLEQVFRWRRSPESRRLFLKSLLAWYEERQKKYGWRPIKAIRLYRSLWVWEEVTRKAFDVEAAREIRKTPSSREIVMEWPGAI